MKRIALLFATLFILVIGISCASAASLNSHSTADKVSAGGVVDDASLGKWNEHKKLYQDASLGKWNEHKKLYQDASLGKWNEHKKLYQSSSSHVSPLGVPVLGSGLGGGGNQNFY